MTTPHLEDEALSAALDGAATGDEESHLASCPQCQAQLASLAAVARAVGAAVAPRPQADIDAAIAEALAAWTPVARPGDLEDRDVMVPITPVVSITPQTGGSRKWLAIAGGIAAALIVVAGIGALARGTSKETATRATAAGPAITTTPTTATGPSPGTVVGGNLGDQSNPSAVAGLVIGALSAASPTATHQSANGSATGIPPGAPSPGAAAPAASEAPRSCVTQAQAALGLAAARGAGAGGVRYQATVEWQGQTPAVVVVFSPPGGLQGAVMRAADCSLLAVLPF